MADRTADAIIVGAGVHGCSLAYHLTQRGVSNVLAFEKDAIGAGATGKSSGLVRLHYTNVPEAVLAQKSYEWFVDWDHRVGGSCGFVKTGFIRIVPERDVPRLRGNLAMMRSVGINTYEVTADDVKEIEPQFRTDDITIAGYEPDSGYADPTSAALTLWERARERGARLRLGVAVTNIKTAGGKAAGVETTEGEYSAPLVIVANNAWSVPLLANLGVDVPITPERHQVAVFYRPAGVGQHVTCIDSIYDMYFRPEGANMTLLGTGEGQPNADPDNYDSRPSMDFWAEAAEKIAARMPAMADAQAGRGMTGIYDVTPDGKPIMGKVPGYENLYVSVGYCGTGFKIAPATGELLASYILTGRSPWFDLEELRLTRFTEGKPLIGEHEYLDEETGKRKDAWLM